MRINLASRDLWPIVSSLSLLSASVLAFISPETATAAELAIPPGQVIVGGQELSLRGHGVSTRYTLEVCVVALYLPRQLIGVDEVLRGSQARRIQIVLLRDVSLDDFRSGLIELGRSDRGSTAAQRSATNLQKLSEELSSRLGSLNRGDVVAIDWVPGAGVTVSRNGRLAAGPIPDEDLFHTLAGIWVGPDSKDSDLRSSLLAGLDMQRTAEKVTRRR